MMRIAYVSADHGVPIFGRKGCSIHAQEVLTTMVRRGAQVELFSTSLQGTPPAGLESLRLHSLPTPTATPTTSAVNADNKVAQVAQRERAALAGNQLVRQALEQAGTFDFVYERYSLWSYGAMEFARDGGLPGLLEVNAPLIEEQAQYRVLVDRPAAERVAERVFGAASALLAVSSEVGAWLESFPAARGKVHVVPNGIRPERFPENLAPSMPAGPGEFTVGFVGTLKAWHGLSVLVEAFALLRQRQSKTRLLIVGDGPEREKLGADLAARGLTDSAVLTGAVEPGAVPGLLASMDVAVAPYPALANFYFSPLKVYEYMAAGVPVVASRIGQLETLIEPEVNGLLVRPGDAGELAQALERLATEPALRRGLSQAARSTVLARYTWDAVLDKILALAGRERQVTNVPVLV